MASASTPPGTPEGNELVARRFPEEVATEGNIDAIDEICTEDVADHSPLGETKGREELKEDIRGLREAFSDFSATVEDVVSNDDLVAMHVTLRGTHDGEFMGTEATGKTFEVGNMVFSRIENGLIAERWVQPDMLGMLDQLGIVEKPEM
ncbi:ester cyclase [Haloferax namakaokahaiae]|uniref:Ester cyclase n=1 Tax=Haloferax namakaokahaiae TaxID=1748331 RepID=A0ABD5ZH61_9EURY